MRTVIVVAGTYGQALDWIKQSGRDRRNVIVANSPAHLEGIVLAQGAVVYVGTWLERPDLPEISRKLEDMQFWWEHRLRRLGGGA